MKTLDEKVTVDILDQYDDHTEVINGVLHRDTSPSYEHGRAQLHIGAVLEPHYGRKGPDGKGGWWFATEVTVEYARDQGYVHDVAGWRRDRAEKPAGTRVTLRPDWACEVISPSNWKKDVVEKYKNLHAFGVPHYWIVEPITKRLTVYRWSTDGYLQIATHEPGDRAVIEPFTTGELDVSRLFGEEEP